MAVNCGVELARLSKRSTVIVDLKPGLGEVGAVPRRSPALQHPRRDRQPAPARPRVPEGAGGQAQVGPRDSRRVGSVRSAGRRRRRRRSRSCSGCWRGSTSTSWWTPAARSIRARSRRSTPPTRCSWSRTRRAVGAQRAAAARARARSSGACGERVRVLLNRAAEPYPIPPKQIESGARTPDSPHVSERLQDRLDRAQLGRAARADGQLRHRRRSSITSRGRFSSPSARRRRRSRREAQAARPRTPRVHLVNP